MSNSGFERAKSNLSIFSQKSILFEKQSPLEPFKSHQNLPMNSKYGWDAFKLWLQFSDFSPFLCAFALKMSYYEPTKQRKNLTGSYAEVLSLVSINSAGLNEILGNIRLLHGEWMRHDSSNCTNLAVYSVTSL